MISAPDELFISVTFSPVIFIYGVSEFYRKCTQCTWHKQNQYVVLHRTREQLSRFARDVHCKFLVHIPRREHANLYITRKRHGRGALVERIVRFCRNGCCVAFCKLGICFASDGLRRFIHMCHALGFGVKGGVALIVNDLDTCIELLRPEQVQILRNQCVRRNQTTPTKQKNLSIRRFLTLPDIHQVICSLQSHQSSPE